MLLTPVEFWLTKNFILQERAVFVRERANGLYTPGSYVIANTVTVVPFLFVSTLLFSVIMFVFPHRLFPTTPN